MLNNYIVYVTTNRLREIYKTEAKAGAHTPSICKTHGYYLSNNARFIFSHIFTREFARHQHLNITWRNIR